MPTSFKVSPKPFFKTLKAPPAKSHAARLLVLAAIDPREIKVKNIPACSDTTFLINALEKTGLTISRKENEVIVHNRFPEDERKTSNDVFIKIGDGGTTARFLTALLARGKNRYVLEMETPMAQRPMEELINSLKNLGAKVEKNHRGLTVQGPAKSMEKSIWVDCEKSSQFASALMLAFGGDISLEIKNLRASKKYISLTENLVKNFKRTNRFTVPTDFASASYPLALGLTAGRAGISNIKNLDKYQADSSFALIVGQMGGQVFFGEKGLHVQKTMLKKIVLDCSPFLDLTPTLAFLCTKAQGDSILHGLFNLQYKESHRLKEIEKLLTLSGAQSIVNKDRLLIKGGSGGRFFDYHAPRDHRMVMAAYLFMRCGKGGVIHNIESVNKSWPDFFRQMED